MNSTTFHISLIFVIRVMNRQLYSQFLFSLHSLGDERSRAACGQHAETGSRPYKTGLAEASSDADFGWTTFLNFGRMVGAVAGYLTWSSTLFVLLVGKDASSSWQQ